MLFLRNDDASLDLMVYRTAWHEAVSGNPLYQADLHTGQFPYTYPPSALLVLGPLGVLPAALAAGLWLVVSAASVVVATRLAMRAVIRDIDSAAAWRLIAWVLATWAVWFGLVLGQVGPVLLVLCTLDLLRGSAPRWSGALIGIAAAVKITPALFLVWLWLTGRRRAALTGALTALLLTGLAWLWLPADSRHYWLDGAFVDVSRNVTLAATGNQSTVAWAFRLTGSDSRLLALALAVMTVTVGLVAALALRRRGAPVSAVALVGVVSAATPPIGWTHQWVWLPLLALALWHEIPAASVRLAAFATAAFTSVPLTFVPIVVTPGSSGVARFLSGGYLVLTIVAVVVALAQPPGTRDGPIVAS